MGNHHPFIKIVPSDDTKDKKQFVLGIIDLQNDFITGSLAINNAIEIIAPINKLRFLCFNYMPTFLSQDCHPNNHMSFDKTHGVKTFTKQKLNVKMDNKTMISVEQTMWPVHCVKNTHGAKIHSDLIITKTDKFVQKGTKANIEGYSAFGDEFNGIYENTYLDHWLKSKRATDIILTGLATDFCVYYTALDAIRLGYDVHLIMTCTKGFYEESTMKAIDDMKEKGVLFYDSVDNFYNFYKEYFIYITI